MSAVPHKSFAMASLQSQASAAVNPETYETHRSARIDDYQLLAISEGRIMAAECVDQFVMCPCCLWSLYSLRISAQQKGAARAAPLRQC
jgi:hypothetical protein